MFATTRWTLILNAAGSAGSEGTVARTALAELCQAYWFPLYAYARRSGYGVADAEDLTQGFFARLLRLDSLAGVRREHGRFRSFLLAAMKNYMADERDRQTARKRGAGVTLSLDSLNAAGRRYDAEPRDHLTPERFFERQWALALLERVVERLYNEYVAAGKEALFMLLRFTITGDEEKLPYEALGRKLGTTPEAARVAAHRLRKRYRELLREEIAQTVDNPAEVEAELAALRKVLSSP